MTSPDQPPLSTNAPVELHPATVDDDLRLLGPWASAFAAVCEKPVQMEALDPTGTEPGVRMTFPCVFEPIQLIGGSGHFRHNPAMVEQVRRMGFAWNDEGRVLTMPAAGAFNERLAAAAPKDSGFRVSYANGTTATMPLGPWLLRYMDGVITVLVNAPEFYESMLAGGLPPQHRDRARWGLQSVAHDLSVHALNYHLIPHAAITAVADRIRAAVPERYALWSQPETIAPLTLTYFYDNDFNRYTYAVWCRCQRPAEFADIFLAAPNFEQLLAALEIRLDETKAGRGDVASGDFDEVGKLADTSFQIA